MIGYAHYCPKCKATKVDLNTKKPKRISACVTSSLNRGRQNPELDVHFFGGCYEDYIHCEHCKTKLIRTEIPAQHLSETIIPAIGYLVEHNGATVDDAIPLLDEMIDLASNNPREYRRKYKMYKNIRKKDLAEFAEELREQKQEMLEKADSKCVPKCPTCGSTNIQKIGTGEKFVSGAFWGLLSTKVHKTYKCLHCDYMW